MLPDRTRVSRFNRKLKWSILMYVNKPTKIAPATSALAGKLTSNTLHHE